MKITTISDVINKLYDETGDNILGVSYGYKTVNGVMTSEEGIVYTVREKLPESLLTEEDLIPKVINVEGREIRTDVIQGEFKPFGVSECEPSFYSWQNTPPQNQNIHRPLIGGISCGNWDNQGLLLGQFEMKYFVGTLGILAKDNETDSLVGLTNNHVIVYDAFICSQRNPTGGTASLVNNTRDDRVTQPNELNSYWGLSYSIGVVKRYYPIRFNVTNQIDAALVAITNPTHVNSNSWNQLNLSSVPSYPWASTAEINSLPLGTLVYSTGRRTGAKGEGVTKLRIDGYGNIYIPYNKQGLSTQVTFGDCITFVATLNETGPIGDTCYSPIEGGDSGSALIASIGGVRKVIGLVFAGTNDNTGKSIRGVACRIDIISSLLNVSSWNGESINYSNPAATLQLTIDGLSDLEYIDSLGKRYWQVGLRYKP